MSKYCVGTIWYSNNCGKFTIIQTLVSKKRKVKFCTTDKIREGKVKDI